MPTSTPAEMAERGFTLVELMVVLMILGLAASAVVLTAQPANGVASDAARLAARLAAARDLAVTANRPVAVAVGREGYAFHRWSGGQWRKLDRGALKAADWPEGTSVSVGGIAGRAATVAGGSARLTFDNLGLPDTPATIALARAEDRATVTVEGDGGVSLQ